MAEITQIDTSEEKRSAKGEEKQLAGKWRTIWALALAELLAMALWFSASAVVPQLTTEWNLTSGQVAWLTMSVQIGFVVGALLSAMLNLADRVPAQRLFALAALVGALTNAAIPLLASWIGEIVTLAIALRFLTGIALAGVYPPGMKLIATWSKRDRGLGIGLLVGALAFGSALPHLLNALPLVGAGGLPPWRPVLNMASGLALVGAIIVWLLVKPGPYLAQAAPFNWRYALRGLGDRPTRLANFGYLGHVWELYAMWAWVPIFLLTSYEAAGWDPRMARVAGFGVVAVGSVGSILAGAFADRIGRTTVTITSLIISGSCALVAGFFFANPLLLTLICLIWGFAVVADSAQFSAAVSELSDARYVGTSLTVQTSMGFLLTLFTIRMVPPLVDWIGWQPAFAFLALGPLFGIWSMWRLRRLPQAAQMASGNR